MNFWGPNLGQRDSRPRTSFFCHFFNFGSLLFPEIAYSDSLEQCITYTRGKTHVNEKKLGTKFGPKAGPK